MKYMRLILGLTLAAASLSGCTSERTSNSGPVAHVKARVLAWGCKLPYDSSIVVYFDDFYSVQSPQLLDGTESRRAKVTFQDAAETSQSDYTDKSSSVEFALQPGLYKVIIESSFSTPDTIHDYAVAHDTSIVLEYVCERRFLPGERP